MNTLLKVGCFLVYLLALTALATELPMGIGHWMKVVAIGLLLVHSIELLFVWKYVKAYEGGITVSVALTLLFGLLHWLPIAKRLKSNPRGQIR
jgi:uncharacterized protein YhhL (DUF1145 family)